jgi:ABC-type glycerol-3-phosphate transport system substrate-binding protein
LRKRLKQLSALSLAAVLVLSACGTKTEEQGTDSPKTSTGPTSSSAPQREKLTLNFMTTVPTNTSSLPSGDKDFIRKTLEEKFNVELKMDYSVLGEEFSTKLNLKLTAGDAPDLFHAEGAKTTKYMLDGAVADLTKYVTPEKMPNYFKWISKEELKRYEVQNAFKRAPVPFEKNQYHAYYVRKDWLDKLNLKVPTNYNEMLEVMKQFTFNDPDGNGKNDTYGFTTFGSGQNVSREFPEWFKNGFGAGLLIDKDNNFIDTGSNKRTGLILDEIRKTLDLKIVDPDWFLNKSGEHLNKVQQGRIGMFYSGSRDIAFTNSGISVQKKTQEVTANPKAEFVAFHIAGDSPITYGAIPGLPFLINAKTPENKITRIMEILDYLASPEGFALANYGKEGVHYKKEGGKITLIPDAFKKDIVDNGNFTEVWGSVFSFGVKDPSPIGLQYVDPRETDHDRAIMEVFKKNKYYVLGTNVAPPTGLDLGAFRKQMNLYLAKVLFEEKDSSNWAKYSEEIYGKYQGKAIFDGYAEQVSTALGKKITFKMD